MRSTLAFAALLLTTASHAAVSPSMRQLQTTAGQQPAIAPPPNIQIFIIEAKPQEEVVGIGVQIGQDDPRVILETVPGSPADQAGLKAGDIILEIDGVVLQGLTLEQTVNKIRGPKDSTANLKVARLDPATGQTWTFAKAIVRVVLPQPADLYGQPLEPADLIEKVNIANKEISDFIRARNLAAGASAKSGHMKAADKFHRSSVESSGFLADFANILDAYARHRNPQKGVDALRARLDTRLLASSLAAAEASEARHGFHANTQRQDDTAADMAVEAGIYNALRSIDSMAKIGNAYLDSLAAAGAKNTGERYKRGDGMKVWRQTYLRIAALQQYPATPVDLKDDLKKILDWSYFQTPEK